MKKLLPVFVSLLILAHGSRAALATTTIPFSIRQAIVWVHCDNRQGSGVVINAAKGLILTNAHVLVDVEKSGQPGSCEVGFITDTDSTPSVFYDASWDHYVFDEATNRDFAVLILKHPQQVKTISPLPSLTTSEFSRIGDPLSIVAYPNEAHGEQTITTGTVQTMAKGFIGGSAKISPGASGGAGLDANNHLIGLATGILIRTLATGEEQVVDYELVDIRAVLTWLDTFGVDMHDAYLTHADAERYHGASTFIDTTRLTCSLLARTTGNASVYCLKSDGTRTVFPYTAVYTSWFSDFSSVVTMTPQDLSNYRLTGAVAMKPGIMVKIQSDPKTYIVADTLGTLRWIQTETRAKELFGDGWAGFVVDIPVEFFPHYHIGEALP